ncbi:MAG: hypothetical protein J1E40_02310 [Oscillospiraceae bacterium]|nr:hypothetical protein [Oscillospiraceae bacterium]
MPENDNEKKKVKSFMDVYREVNEKERAEELKRESELAAAAAERERKARNEYAEKLRQDRLELLKLKQGVISEEDLPKEEKVEKHYTVWEKIGNFFYHNKIAVILGTMFAALAIFLIYDLVTTVRPDVAVMVIAEDPNFDFIVGDMQQVLERYCGDFNGDGKVLVRVTYMPVKYTGDMYHENDMVKLMGEFQGEDSIVVIADRDSCETFGINENVLADLSGEFPDDENVNPLGYMLSGTSFKEDIGYDDLSDDLFIGFRMPQSGIGLNEEKFQNNFESAIEMWRNYLNDNIVNPSETE